VKPYSDPIKGRDVEILRWIHENRFTDLSLYGEKFSRSPDFRDWRRALNRLEKKGLLTRSKRGRNEEPVYVLTEAAQARLSKDGVLLIRNPQPVKIVWNCLIHDRKVVQIRTKFERELIDLFWVTDYEMRRGVSPKTKSEFLSGKLDVVKWRWNRGAAKERFNRTPDAYFEATVGGIRKAFVLEYVHAEYSKRKYDEIIPRLVQRFQGAIKLLVYQDDKATIKNIAEVKRRVKDREGWWAGSHERVVSLPFLEAFEDLK